MNRPSQVYKDLAFCENPLEREQEVEDIKVEKIRSLQEVTFFTYNEDGEALNLRMDSINDFLYRK